MPKFSQLLFLFFIIWKEIVYHKSLQICNSKIALIYFVALSSLAIAQLEKVLLANQKYRENDFSIKETFPELFGILILLK